MKTEDNREAQNEKRPDVTTLNSIIAIVRFTFIRYENDDSGFSSVIRRAYCKIGYSRNRSRFKYLTIFIHLFIDIVNTFANDECVCHKSRTGRLTTDGLARACAPYLRDNSVSVIFEPRYNSTVDGTYSSVHAHLLLYIIFNVCQRIFRVAIDINCKRSRV